MRLKLRNFENFVQKMFYLFCPRGVHGRGFSRQDSQKNFQDAPLISESYCNFCFFPAVFRIISCHFYRFNRIFFVFLRFFVFFFRKFHRLTSRRTQQKMTYLIAFVPLQESRPNGLSPLVITHSCVSGDKKCPSNRFWHFLFIPFNRNTLPKNFPKNFDMSSPFSLFSPEHNTVYCLYLEECLCVCLVAPNKTKNEKRDESKGGRFLHLPGETTHLVLFSPCSSDFFDFSLFKQSKISILWFFHLKTKFFSQF